MQHATNDTVTRRRFLAGSLGGAAGLLIVSPRSAFAYPANERLNVALVGVSGYAAAVGFVPSVQLYENLQITALCDVDLRKVAPARELWEQRARQWPSSGEPRERQAAERYRQLADDPPPLVDDYRRLFDELGEAIDAVVVATPDHTHAAASAEALRAGKHVLCEKPLTITVDESRALRQLAAERPVATSMGNQGTQSPQFRRGLELIRDGVIGPVEQVHVWFDRGGRNLQRPPEGTHPVPQELNWNLWLGPVAWREYHPEWIARTHWRDTSAGELGNFGPHTANLAFMALNVADLWNSGSDATIRVDADCSETNRLSFPTWERIRWQVPARGELPPVTFTWHQGPDFGPGTRELVERLMRDHGAGDEDVQRLLLYAGAMIIGSKGAIVTDSHNVNVTLLPKEKFAEVDVSRPRTIAASRGHYHDWVHACRGGEAPLARFEYSATLNEFLMLGDVATRFPGDRLDYDPLAGRIENHAEADQALAYDYRQGWRL